MRYPIIVLAIIFPFITHAQIITTVAGNGGSVYAGDGGPATSAQFYQPFDVAFDGAGNMYIADYGDNRVRKVSTSGIITTFAGKGPYIFGTYGGDGGPADSANLYQPSGVAVDGAGNVFIADGGNNRIRKVNTSGIISTYAGTGVSGYSGDGGPATAAKLNGINSIAADAAGNLYICDPGNNRIRKVDTLGIIHTIAGTGTYGSTGDGGPADSAQIEAPDGITVDAAGNIYFADYENWIRKIDHAGIISTIGGNGVLGFSGDGGPADSAAMGHPWGIAVDATGNVFVADRVNNRIRNIVPSGIITTIAGIDSGGYCCDGGPADSAMLYGPVGMSFDHSGNLFVADIGNERIRKISFATTTNTKQQMLLPGVKLYPDPAGKSVTVENAKDFTVTVFDMTGRQVYTTSVSADKETLNTGSLTNGVYLLRFLNPKTNCQVTRTLVIH